MQTMGKKTCRILSSLVVGFGLLLIYHYYPQSEYKHNLLPSQPSPGSKAVNIYFLRTFKTGSTTLYNIFARFAWKNNLRFTTFERSRLFQTRGLEKRFHFNETMKKYNMLTEHGVYDPKRIEKILLHPVFHVTLVRNPVSWLASYLRYKHLIEPLELDKSNPAVSFVTKLSNNTWLKYHRRLTNTVSNLTAKIFTSGFTQAFEFKMSSIEKLVEIFHVGVTEYFDESVILFRRKLGWSFEDIIYLPLCIQSYQRVKTLDPTIQTRYCQWASADCRLYDYVKNIFLERFNKEGQDIKDEVTHYKDVLKKVSQFCTPFYDRIRLNASDFSMRMLDAFQPLQIPASKWHPYFTYNVKECAISKLKSMVFRAYFYYKQTNDRRCSRRCPVTCTRRLCNTICQSIDNETLLLEKVLSDGNVYTWEVETVADSPPPSVFEF